MKAEEPLQTVNAATGRIAVIGLGYVGLPVAVAFAKRCTGTIGFDISKRRVEELREHVDVTGEVSAEDLRGSGLRVTLDPGDLSGSAFFIVTVPTPIDSQNRPDFGPLRAASETVGRALSKGAIVCYESTVYPGATETICGPILERASGLRCGEDFKLAYSPERINPGDTEHTFERILKVVAAQDDETLQIVAERYSTVVDAGVFRAPSIAVAEAAKVIENTQRDLNIALMNELAIVFDRLGIDTLDVLEAAGTKWNFLPFRPGLVGGHCIGVDPYYLTSRAEQVGIHPEVILAGRRVNDGMGRFVAQRAIKLLIGAGRSIQGATVAVVGLTFKENVRDVRNSRVPSIVSELTEYGVEVAVCDPVADPVDARRQHGIELVPFEQLTQIDAIILAVPHDGLAEAVGQRVVADDRIAVVCDVKGALDRSVIPGTVRYWRL